MANAIRGINDHPVESVIGFDNIYSIDSNNYSLVLALSVSVTHLLNNCGRLFLNVYMHYPSCNYCQVKLGCISYLLINFPFKFRVPVMFVIPKNTSEQRHYSLPSDTLLDSLEEWNEALHQRNTHGI